MSAQSSRPCKACGAMLVFAVGPNGKAIPLQRVRKIYNVSPAGVARDVDLAGEQAFVSHFETCPNADRFSKRNG